MKTFILHFNSKLKDLMSFLPKKKNKTWNRQISLMKRAMIECVKLYHNLSMMSRCMQSRWILTS